MAMQLEQAMDSGMTNDIASHKALNVLQME